MRMALAMVNLEAVLQQQTSCTVEEEGLVCPVTWIYQQAGFREGVPTQRHVDLPAMERWCIQNATDIHRRRKINMDDYAQLRRYAKEAFGSELTIRVHRCTQLAHSTLDRPVFDLELEGVPEDWQSVRLGAPDTRLPKRMVCTEYMGTHRQQGCWHKTQCTCKPYFGFWFPFSLSVSLLSVCQPSPSNLLKKRSVVLFWSVLHCCCFCAMCMLLLFVVLPLH